MRVSHYCSLTHGKRKNKIARPPPVCCKARKSHSVNTCMLKQNKQFDLQEESNLSGKSYLARGSLSWHHMSMLLTFLSDFSCMDVMISIFGI